MNTPALSSAIALVFGLAVLLWAVVRYAGERPLHERVRTGAAWTLTGVALLNTYAWQSAMTRYDLLPLAASLAAGGLLAVVRGGTVRLFTEDGRAMRQDRPVTTLLWALAVPQHLLLVTLLSHGRGTAYGGLGLGSSSLLLYFGVVLSVQQTVVRRRSRGTLRALGSAASAAPPERAEFPGARSGP
ncbi:hypothetical protein ACFXPI_27135 [Streptomyces sp. NPDC059104]|uniref:hypothetical protein n=1 Tax=Streptomyces sp. NPDC059104 TaxID=3346729 RepID=UPI00369ECE4F